MIFLNLQHFYESIFRSIGHEVGGGEVRGHEVGNGKNGVDARSANSHRVDTKSATSRYRI